MLFNEKQNKLIAVIKKTALATIIGFACFFSGLFLALISPLIALLSLVYNPAKMVSFKLNSFEDTLKEFQDPDSKEKWKKDHDNLFPPEENGE